MLTDISTLLGLANVQMAAEALLHKFGSQATLDALKDGNKHASVFPPALATSFKDQWTVVDHQQNTSTGFSATLFRATESDPAQGITAGQLVMSLRSTEFIDDAARDNEATNKFEISDLGWAFGQISDMEAWWNRIKSQVGTAPLTVTGYSLGGHLATAFNLMHRSEIPQLKVVTFNGAGVGRIGDGSWTSTQMLAEMIDEFRVLRQQGAAAYGLEDAAFRTDYGRNLYRQLVDILQTQPLTEAAYLNAAQALRMSEAPSRAMGGAAYANEKRDWELLSNALNRASKVYSEAQRAPSLSASASNPSEHPQNVPAAEIAGASLNYQLSVLLTAGTYRTSSLSVAAGLGNAFGNKTYGDGFLNITNQIDMVGTEMDGTRAGAMVANSQLHYGHDARTFIESQPGYRGSAPLDSAWQSVLYSGAKLLSPNYADNDFGDTHSLVLLVDSLSVQDMLLRLVPASHRNRVGQALNAVLQQASNLKGQTVHGTPGKAEGDVLENVVNALATLTLGPNSFERLKGSAEGNTWWIVDPTTGSSGREAMHLLLGRIAGSTLYEQVKAGAVTLDLLPSSGALAASARDDFGAFAALCSLSPFVVKAGSGDLNAVLGSAWGTEHAAWTSDRTLTASDRSAGKQNFSDKWIADRAAMLDWLAFRNRLNIDTQISGAQAGRTIPESLNFESRRADGSLDQRVLAGTSDNNNQRKQVVFGDSGADSIVGYGRGDGLYGGAGNDTLSGQGGADHLEGNAGNDTLIGGSGADTLFGGSGSDTYLFTRADLTERATDVIGDADGLGQIQIAAGLDGDGKALDAKPLALTGWRPADGAASKAPQRFTNDAGFTLTVARPNLWTVTGKDLATEVTLRVDADHTLSLDFGRDRARIEVRGWQNKHLDIEIPDYQSRPTPPPALPLAQTRDLALLQMAAGCDLTGVGDTDALRARLSGAPGRSGTVDRMTPAQADWILSRYEVLGQLGNDGAGFSATVFRSRDPGASNPYVIAFRGTDFEPDRVAGIPKDGGLGALREINRHGIAWAQIDAMERFWAALGQGRMLDRAGQWVDVAWASGLAASRSLVIGSGTGAHLAAAFTLLHPQRVEQGIGFDGPGLGGVGTGAGNARAITAAELKTRLDLFVELMAYRGDPLGSSHAQAFRDAGVYEQFAAALEADRPSEVLLTRLFAYLGTPQQSMGHGAIVASQPQQGWDNFWDGANIYNSQLYQFVVRWLSRDLVGAGQGTLTPLQGDGVGDGQLAQALARLDDPSQADPVTGRGDPATLAWPGLPLDGAAAGRFTHWSARTDRIDPSMLVSGQGFGGEQRAIWVEDALGAARPATTEQLQQDIHRTGWGVNTPANGIGGSGNLTRIADSLEIATLLQRIDPSTPVETFQRIARATSRASTAFDNPRMPVSRIAYAAGVESRDMDTLERLADALSLVLPAGAARLAPGPGAAGHLDRNGARSAWSDRLQQINQRLDALQAAGARLSLLDLTVLTADQIAGLASGHDANGIAVRHALVQGHAFAVVDAAGIVYASADDPLVRFAPDGSAGSGPGAATHGWIRDRAALLVGLMTARRGNLDDPALDNLPDVMATTQGWSTLPLRWSFSDETEATTFTFGALPGQPALDATLPKSLTRFGRNDSAFGDELAGGAQDDWLYGQAGSDQLNGGAGDDRLEGGRGSDRLFGGSGADLLDGGLGSDRLEGGAGSDTYRFRRGDGADLISDRHDATGQNHIVFGPGIRKEDLSFTVGDDTLRIAVGGSGAGDHITLLQFDRFDRHGRTNVARWIDFDDGSVHDLRVLINNAPRATQDAVAPLAVGQGEAVRLQLPASLFGDIDSGDSLTWQVGSGDTGGLPPGLGFDAATKTIYGRPLAAGSAELTIAVTDTAGARAERTVALQVLARPVPDPNPDNHAPQATQSTLALHATAGRSESLALPAALFTDPDAGDLLDVQARLADGTPLPGWMGFDAASMRFVVDAPADALGSLAVVLQATDLGGLSAEAEVVVEVVAAPGPRAAQALPEVQVVEDQPLDWQLPDSAFDGLGADATLSAQPLDDSPMPPWLKFDAASRRLSGTPPDAPADPLRIRITAADGAGNRAEQLLALAVVPGNDAPQLNGSLNGVQPVQDQAFTWTVPRLAFSDAESGHDLQLTVSMADGSALPAWLKLDDATGTLSGTPRADDVGTVALSVRARDPQGGSSTHALTLVVANVNDAPVLRQPVADIAAVEGVALDWALPASSFFDADGEPLAVAVTRLDGGALPGWLAWMPATAPDAHAGRLVGTPGNADVGALDLKLTVRDAGGSSASDTVQLRVANVNQPPVVAASLQPVAATAYEPFAVVLPEGAFADPDAGDTVRWNLQRADGSPLPAWLQFDPANRRLSGRAIGADVGAISLRASAADTQGESVAQTLVLNISPGAVANQAPRAGSIVPPAQALVGEAFEWRMPTAAFSDADRHDLLAYTVTQADGSVLPAWLRFDAGSLQLTGMPLAASPPLALRVTARDRDGDEASQTFTLAVSDVTSRRQGTSADDVLAGSGGSDVIDGAGGCDDLRGAGGADILRGGAGNDRVGGDTGNDQLFGGEDDDTLTGGAGNDALRGDAGSDFLWGDEGEDWIEGGAGADQLRGGEGSDLYVYATGHGMDQLHNAAPDNATTVDQLLLRGVAPAAVVARRMQSDLLLQITDADSIRLVDYFAGGALANEVSVDEIGFDDGTVWRPADVAAMVIRASGDRDVLYGASDRENVLGGGGGGDQLYGHRQADVLHGDAGNDMLFGAAGDDWLDGGDGADWLDGEDGNDTLRGGDGDDGTAPRDSSWNRGGGLYGGPGDDDLDGGAGNDFLAGGPGSDIYRFGRGSGHDTIENDDSVGGRSDGASASEVDAVVMAPGVLPGDVTAARNGDWLELRIAGTTDQLDIAYFVGDTPANDRKVDEIRFANGVVWRAEDIRERVLRTSDGNDRIQAFSDAAETIRAGGGDDVVEGGGGADSLFGDGGNDRLDGEDGADALDGGGGDDTLDGGNGLDGLSGGDGRDMLRGGAGDDLVEGGAGDDGDKLFEPYMPGDIDYAAARSALYGGAGNDTLDGGAGNDLLVGGEGADVYRFARGGGQDRIVAFDYWNGRNERGTANAYDVLAFDAGLAPDEIAVSRAGDDLVLQVAATTDRVVLERFFREGSTDHPHRIEQVRFADGTVWTDQELLSRLYGSTRRPPVVVGTPATLMAVEDEAGLIELPAASFTDPDGDALRYRVTGAAGQPLPGWVQHVPPATGSGPGSLRVSARNDEVGSLPLELTAIDPSGFRATTTLTLRVDNRNDAPVRPRDLPAVVVTEDRPFVWTVPGQTFVDVDAGDSLTWAATTADGQALPGWLSFDAATQTFAGTAPNAAVGLLRLSIQVADRSGAVAAAPLTFDVGGTNDAPRAGTPVPVLDVAAYQSISIRMPDDAIVDIDPGDRLGWRMTCADGSTLPGWLRFDETTRTLNGRAVNADASTHALRLVARDLAGVEAAVPVTLRVAGGPSDNRPPTGPAALSDRKVAAGAPFEFALPVGAFVDADAFDRVELSARQADGTPLPSWLTFDAARGAFSGAAEVAERLSVEVTATDRDGATVSRGFTLSADGATPVPGTPDRDLLDGGGADDLVLAAAGDDVLHGNAGDDALQGGEGSDHLAGGSGNDTLAGDGGADLLTGGDGDDDLIGGDGADGLLGDAGDDVLDGGRGTDRLWGGSGSDVYRWGRGDGADRIDNRVTDGLPAGADVLEFKPGISPADLVLRRQGDFDLVIAVAGSDDAVELVGFFEGNRIDNPNRIGSMRFADGTRWDGDEVLRRASLADDGGRFLQGTVDRDNRLIGGAGHDDLRGQDRADTLSGGTGRDRLFGNGGNDWLEGGDGHDGGTLPTYWATALGLWGGAGDDTLDGGAGDDDLRGGPGSDTYRFGRGHGVDTIEELPAESTDVDVVRFGAGVAPQDLRFVRTSNQLDVEIAGTGDRLRLMQQFFESRLRSGYGVERFVFADGSELTLDQIADRIDPEVDQSDDLLGTHDQLGFDDRQDTLRAVRVDRTERLRGLGGNDLLEGNAGVEYLLGGTGHDTLLGGDGDDGWMADGSTGGLWGEEGDDVLRGGKGIDYLSGGPGSDEYRFERGDGIDRIVNVDGRYTSTPPSSSDVDVLQFGAGIAPHEVRARKSGADLILSLGSAGDEVTVVGQFRADAEQTGAALREVRFADATAWTAAQLIARVQTLSADADTYEGFDHLADSVDGGAGADRLLGLGGNDTLLGGDGDDGGRFAEASFGGLYRVGGLFGGAGDDVLDGGAGDDYLEGGDGADVFRFAPGGGHDRVGDFAAQGGADEIRLGAPATVDNTVLTREGDALIVRLVGGQDELRLEGYFASTLQAPADRVVIRFADGSTIHSGQIAAAAVTPTAGDDVIVLAGDFNRALNAGAGNDRVETAGGADRVLGGDGNDTLVSGAGADELDGDAGDDTIDLGDGDDIARGGDGRDRIVGGAGNDSVDGGAGDDYPQPVGANAILRAGVHGGAGHDTLAGGSGRDLLMGDAGDDRLLGGDGDDGGSGWLRYPIADGGEATWAPGLFGGDGNDTLEGGAGSDNLSGGPGSDTYVFGRGDGQDRVLDRTSWDPNAALAPKPSTERDLLLFRPGITPADIVATRSSYDLVLSVAGTTDQVRIERYFSDDRVDHDFRFAEVRFDDGTIWTSAEILRDVSVGTGGPDTLLGVVGMTVLQGLGGDDRLSAGNTGPSHGLTYDGGDGNDSLVGYGGDEVLLGGPGNDTLLGGSGNDTLDGGPGADRIETGPGNDRVSFDRGSGADEVLAHASGANDTVTVSMGSGLLPVDVTARLSSDDVEISIRGTADRLLLKGALTDGKIGLAFDRVAFGDGTVWTPAELTTEVLRETAGNDSIAGFAAADSIAGGAGDDVIQGRSGADTLAGGDGNDQLYGHRDTNDYGNSAQGNGDLFDGGPGNDLLFDLEATDGDTYLLAPGGGQDSVRDWGGSGDTLRIGSNVAPSDLTLRSDGASLVAALAGGERLTVSSALDASTGQPAVGAIERVQWSDGSEWDAARIRLELLRGSVRDDRIIGFVGPDSITGDAGADTLQGGGGNDTIEGGTGSDLLRGDAGDDRLDGGDDADTLEGGDGVDLLTGGAGNDTLQGGAGADILDGGIGADWLNGGEGDDTYRWRRGAGDDIVAEDGGGLAPGSDTLVLEDVMPADLSITRDAAAQVKLTIVASGESLTLQDQAREGTGYRWIETVRFADGSAWSRDALVAQAVLTGTAGADTLTGLESAESVAAGAGADLVYGRGGDDAIRGGDGDDTLYGEAGADTLRGGPDRDTLDGGAGNNRYDFAPGDGQDTIVGRHDATPGKTNRLQFDAPITPAQVQLQREAGGGTALLVKIGSGTDLVTVRDFFSGAGPANPSNPVQQMAFADGTVWDLDAIVSRMAATANTVPGTASNDLLTGTTGADLLDGGAGNDTLRAGAGDDQLVGGEGSDSLVGEAGNDRLDGGSGNDALDGGLGNNTYVFGRGDGQDVIQTGSDGTAGKLNTIEFRAGVAPADVIARRLYDSGYESLELAISGTADKITARYAFFGNDPANAYNPVQQVRFADGTVWDLAAIKAQVFAGTAGADSIAGTLAADSIGGQAGADTLYGRDSNDSLAGGDGNDSLYGEAGSDRLDGGPGNDTLDGGLGNNTYVFGRGDGQDVIQTGSDGSAGKLNTIEFRAGVAPADVVARRLYDSGYESLELAIAGTTDKITARYAFFGNDPANAYNPVQQVRFADGTTWDLAAIKAQVFAGTAGADSIAGTLAADSIGGQAGADTLYGRDGNDSLAGGDGNDSLYGEAGSDRLDGGTGNDTLDGGLGGNTYVFGRGDGQDVIQTGSDATAGKLNTIEFRAGVAPADVIARRLYDSGWESLELSIAGTADKITARYAFFGNDPANPYNPVQQVRFADGTTWDLAAIKAQVFAGTAGADSIAGTLAADSISGQAGADTLYGRDGNDTLAGGDGNDSLLGEAGADWLDGGAGNDTLQGGSGNDTYSFGRGGGADLLLDTDSTANNQDRLEFGSDIAAEQLWFRRIGSDLEVSIIGGSDKVTVQSWYAGSAYQVETLRLASGRTLLNTQVDALVSAMAAFAPPAAGQTTLTAPVLQALSPVIAASWSS